MNFLLDFVTVQGSGKNITVVTVAQGISLALSRMPTARRASLIAIGQNQQATESLLSSLFNKVQDGQLASQGDVARWLSGN